MNILLMNHYAGSPEMGMEFRPYYLAREWVKMGHRVDIIAADYSHLRMKNPHVSKDFQEEQIDGISYHWVKAGRYSGNGVKRALTMFRFVGKLLLHAKKIAKEWKPDVVITSSTYPLDTYAGQRIARFSKARLVHEVHDMWPATLIEIGGMSKCNPFIVVLQMAENSAYRHSSFVVSLLPKAKDYMVQHGMKPDKFVEIPNGIVLDDWKNPEELPKEHKAVLEQIKQEEKFVVGYFGGHALTNALDLLLDAAKEVRKENIQFVLVGGGVEKSRLMKRAEEEGIKNMCFLGAVSKKEVPSLVTYFDCSYLGAKNSPLYRFGICMNKMYDSMMAGKPMVCAVNTPDSAVERYQCGILISTVNAAQIAKAIEELEQMSNEERRAIGERGKQAVLKYFTYDILARKFLDLFTGEEKNETKTNEQDC